MGGWCPSKIRFWVLDLKLKNRDGLEVTEKLHNKEEIRVFHQDLLNLLLGNGGGAESEKRPQHLLQRWG